MKTTNAQPLVKMDREELQALCTEVKETLATDQKMLKQTFGVADLWKIHRNTRYRVQRRNSMF